MSSLHNRQDRDAPPFSDAKSGKTLTSRASILDRHTLPYPPLVASPPTSFSGRGAQELHDMGMHDARRTMYKESSSMLPASVLSQKPSSALASTRAGAPRNAQNDKRDVFVRDRDSDASHLYPKKPVSASSASRTVSASESTKSVVREASVAAEEAKSSSSANDKLDEAVSRIIKTLRLKSSTISGFPASKLEGIISVIPNSNPMSPNAFNSTSNYSDQFNSRSEPLFIQDIERQARAEASSKYLPTPLERHFDGSSPGRLLAKSSSKAEDLDSVKVSFAFAAHALRLANAKRLASASSRLDAAAASKFGASDAEPQVYSGSASNSEINGSQKSESDSSEDDEMPCRSALEELSGAKIASAQLSIKTQAQKSRFSQMPQPLPLFSERCPDVPLSAAETGAYATLERPDHVDQSPPREPFDESNSAEKIQQRYEVFCASKHQAYNEIPDRSNLVFDANVMIRDQSVFFDPEDYGCTKPIPSLTFSGKFESGNLRRAFRVGCYEYNLFLSYDVLTQGHTQWYYFRTSGMQKGVKYTFHIVNLLKKKSLYQKGLMPLLYSDKTAAQTGIGWYRAGVPLAYGMNKMKRKAKKNFVTFTFSMQFPFTDDTCYIAHCYPYRYSDLLRHLGEFEKEDAGRFLRKRVMCDTIGGNEVHLLTITDRTTPDLNSKPVVLLTARVHPGETNASWMMLGTLKYLLSPEASALRRAYVFKVVPMLNVDGVVVGNYRCSLSGHDLNRRYHNPDARKHSEIYMLKKVVQGIKETQSIVLYIDYHGHSCKPGFFFYGCDHSFVKSKSGPLHHRPEEEKVFPWLVQQNADAFVYKDCSFSIKKSKETTGRVIMWKDFGIVQSLTMEASLGGCRHGPLKNLQFSSAHFEQIGKDICATLNQCEIIPTLFDETLKQLQFMDEARRMREDASLSKAAFDMFLASAPPGTIVSESMLDMAVLNKSGTDSDVSSSSDEDIVQTQLVRKKYKKRKGKTKSKKAVEVVVAAAAPPPLPIVSSMSSTLEARVANATQPSLRRNVFLQQGSEATRINGSKFVERLRSTTDTTGVESSVSTKACLLAKAEDSRNLTKPQNAFPSFKGIDTQSAIKVVNFDIDFPGSEIDRTRMLLATPYTLSLMANANLRRPADQIPPRTAPQRAIRYRQAPTVVDLRGTNSGDWRSTGYRAENVTSGSELEADENATPFQ